MTACTAAISSGGPLAHPTFQPVQEKVFPADEIDTVRSAIPGKVDSGRCTPSKTRCSYTSSVTASRSCSRHSDAMAPSSASSNTRPVGLCGEFTRISRVRGPTAAANSSGSKVKPGSRRVTARSWAPAMAIAAG